MTDNIFNTKFVKYEDDKKYIRVGGEWISLDDLVTKQGVLKLVDTINHIVSFVSLRTSLSEDARGFLFAELDKVRENLK